MRRSALSGAMKKAAAEHLRDELQMDGMPVGELSDIFESEPPDLNSFLYDISYLNHMRPTLPNEDLKGYAFELSPIQYDFIRNFEQIFKPETYIAMVEEFGPHWAPLPMKNMFVSAWGKGSSDPNTPVYSPRTGQWIPLKDFSGGDVSAVDIEDRSLATHYGTSSFREGEGRMFKVTTRTGRTSLVWEGHRFLTKTGWKRLWDLREGDQIALASYLPEPEEVREAEIFELLDLIEDLLDGTAKGIPDEVFSLSDEDLQEFLWSWFVQQNESTRTSQFVEENYVVHHEQVARDLVNLLLRRGQVAHLKKTASGYSVYVPKTLGLSDPADGDLYWDRITSIEYSHFGEYWTLSVDGPANYISNGGVVDHNSGKDTTVRIGVVRIASLLQHMKSPQSYFNMASFDPIHLLNVAVSAPQARRAFFDPMKKLFTSNRYLSGMFYGDDPAEGSNTIRLKNNVYIISGNSMAESQEGLNLIAGVADEISAFKVAEEFRDKGDGRSSRGADQIVSFLESSASTRFPQTYKVAQISYPRFSGDAIEKAIAQGKESNKKYGDKSKWYVSGPYATWEVKPGVKEEDFAEAFEKDFEDASAKYACRPPKSSNTFIRDEDAIDACFETVRDEEPIQVDYYFGLPAKVDLVAPDGKAPKPGWQVKFTYASDMVPKEGAIYNLHGDMAIKGDRAGIAMSHVRTVREGTSDDDMRPIIKNDFTFTFESDLKEDPPREVQLRWYRQLIWELIERGFEIEWATFDSFGSAEMIQNLDSYGISSKILSLDRNDRVYQTLKDTILDGRLEGYRLDPALDTLPMKELKKLRKVGKKVDHLPGFSKDAADALAGSVFNAILAGGEEYAEDDVDSTPDSPEMYWAMMGVGGNGMQTNPWGGANPFAGNNSTPSILNTGYFRS